MSRRLPAAPRPARIACGSLGVVLFALIVVLWVAGASRPLLTVLVLLWWLGFTTWSDVQDYRDGRRSWTRRIVASSVAQPFLSRLRATRAARAAERGEAE